MIRYTVSCGPHSFGGLPGLSRDFFWVDLSVLTRVKINFLVKRVDEEVKELVLVDCIVCLCGFLGAASAGKRFN